MLAIPDDEKDAEQTFIDSLSFTQKKLLLKKIRKLEKKSQKKKRKKIIYFCF